MIRTILWAGVCTFALGAGAFAQTVSTEVQRDVNQQTRIEQGLKSGQLTTGEAARLEQGAAKIDGLQSNALKDGNLSPAEKRRIQRAQNRESQQITKLEGNARTGDPNSASSRRLQADVQRNVNQETRIEQGIKSGALSRRDVGQLEQGQSQVARREAKAGADGHVGAYEQRRIQAAENRQSRRIHKEKVQ